MPYLRGCSAAGFEPPDHLNPDLQRRSRVTGLGIEQINHPLGSFPSDADRPGRGNRLQPIAEGASQQVRPGASAAPTVGR